MSALKLISPKVVYNAFFNLFYDNLIPTPLQRLSGASLKVHLIRKY